MISLTLGLIYGAAITGYLFVFMITFSPRVWGYKDYSEAVKKKVAPQTRKEKTLAAIIGLPWLVFVLGFPIYSTFVLKAKLGAQISFLRAFLHIIVLFMFATFGDLVLLDWLVISKITPKFVVIPGTVKEDYKDFSHHFRGHAKAIIPMIILAVIMAGLARML
jgi:hypothetical protein